MFEFVKTSATNGWTLVILGICDNGSQTNSENFKKFIYLNFVEYD